MLVTITAATSVTACATPAVVRPIGIRGGSTEYRVTCREESACNTATARICTQGHYLTAYMAPGFQFVCSPGLPAKSNEAPKEQAIEVLISPECKDMFYGPDFIDLDTNGKKISAEGRPKPDYVAWDPARAIPMSYKDPRTSITIYVESDGRHLAAMDEHGKLLWVRNPWEEAHAFCPYRTPRPVLSSLTMVEFTSLHWSNLKSRGVNPAHRFITVAFDSSQFGVLDESTGDFFPEGQN
jgi:hypothetical protein